MSSGRTHQKASIMLAASLSLCFLANPSTGLLEAAGGALAGVLLSPDLDLDAGNISNYIIRKKVGWFGEKIWRWFWRPYSESFKHRGFASHFPVFSTVVRLLYVLLMAITPFYVVYHYALLPIGINVSLERELAWWSRQIFLSWFTVGLCASDLIHYFLDALTKESK